MATFEARLDAYQWLFAEKGLQRFWTELKAFANAAAGSTVTLPDARFGLLDLSDPADVAQAPTGVTGITPSPPSFPNPGRDRISETQPHNGFRT
jgi:hypothetical protein